MRGTEIQPAHLSQLLKGQDGRLVEIPGDVGGVVSDLQRLDRTLRVRVLEDATPPIFVVYQRIEEKDRITEHLVTTVEAYFTQSGTVEGLDQRVVRRVEEIMHPSYDLPGRIESHASRRECERKKDLEEKVGETAELMVHALRRGNHVTDRVFVP